MSERTTGVRRTKSQSLTPVAIQAMKPGEKHADGHMPTGNGRLIVKARSRTLQGRPTIVREFFFRYLDADKKDRTILVGEFTPSRKDDKRSQSDGNDSAESPTLDAEMQRKRKLTLTEARAEALTYAELVRQGIDPRHWEEEQVHKEQETLKRKREERAREDRKGTLADLLDAYVDHLRKGQKNSADDVERTLARHVLGPFPGLADKKASEITADDVSDILARMIALGIERRTNMVRSYLRAAFSYGAKIDSDPRRKAAAIKAAEELPKKFAIRGNPVADVPRAAEFDKAGNRTLTDAELRAYWQALSSQHPGIGVTLKVALLLGGQRLSQVIRAKWQDYDPEDRSLLLHDSKGRGGTREHLLPVSDRVAEVIDELRRLNHGEYIFSTTDGQKPVHLSTLSAAVSAIGAQTSDAGSDIAFTAADLRRTVETRLGALGVPKAQRAQVLSHGAHSDVQAKHYERFDDLPAKAAVLARWESHLADILDGKQTGRVIRGRFRAGHPQQL